MSLAERQKYLLRTGEFSDFILTVDGRDFNVHRCVICPQSAVLHRLCAGNFKEGLEGRGTLAEESADVFERILQFVYTGEYDCFTTEAKSVPGENTDIFDKHGVTEIHEDETESMRQQSTQLMVHTEVYLLAKYLDIAELMQHATSKFRALVKTNFRADGLIESFARVFNHGSDGDCGLRAQILELCLENFEHIEQEGELALLLLQHEPFAWKMLFQQAHEHACQAEKAHKRQRTLEENLQTAQETIQTLSQRVEEMTSDRDRMLTLLEKFDRCRNCEKEFGSYVDKDERGIVRCKGCRCRHYS